MSQRANELTLSDNLASAPIGTHNPPPLTPDLLDQDRPIAAQATQAVLNQSEFEIDWSLYFNDDALDSFTKDGFVVLESLFSHTALLALQAESGFVDYRDAKLAEGVRQPDIRGDRIRWIGDNFFAGFYYLQSIEALARWLNRTLFAGIRHSEAHYACYPPGFGYQWHTDNPNGRDERVVSAVFYLNDDWRQTDGGELAIVDNYGNEHKIIPKANRLVVFDSNLQHQVEIAHRQRYSIATWLRRDDPVRLVA